MDLCVNSDFIDRLFNMTSHGRTILDVVGIEVRILRLTISIFIVQPFTTSILELKNNKTCSLKSQCFSTILSVAQVVPGSVQIHSLNTIHFSTIFSTRK